MLVFLVRGSMPKYEKGCVVGHIQSDIVFYILFDLLLCLFSGIVVPAPQPYFSGVIVAFSSSG